MAALAQGQGASIADVRRKFRRIKDIVEEIYRLNLHEKAKFSLIALILLLRIALNHGFKMINDITANANLAPLAARYDAQFA